MLLSQRSIPVSFPHFDIFHLCLVYLSCMLDKSLTSSDPTKPLLPVIRSVHLTIKSLGIAIMKSVATGNFGRNKSMISLNRDTLNRDGFRALILQECSLSLILEIGPLNRPLISTTETKYFDLLPTDKLRDKAKSEGLDPKTVPIINFSDPNGNLGVIQDSFENIVSSHCVEHQPDLISHLVQCSKLLKGSDARYWLVVPDKRYCFDALIPESGVLEIVKAHEEKLTQPSVWKVIEHRALTTHNDPVLHWKIQHGAPNLDIKARYMAAESEYQNADGKYIDVHCWQFTPESLSTTIDALYKLDLIDFQIERVWETRENDLEFFAVLRKMR